MNEGGACWVCGRQHTMHAVPEPTAPAMAAMPTVVMPAVVQPVLNAHGQPMVGPAVAMTPTVIGQDPGVDLYPNPTGVTEAEARVLYDTKTRDALRKVARGRGLMVSGLKRDLVERLALNDRDRGRVILCQAWDPCLRRRLDCRSR